MLLFDTSKKLEKALGEEAAAALAHAFEEADAKWRQELATKADLEKGLSALRTEISAAEVRLIKWMVGGFLAQSALLIAVMAFLK